MTSTTSAAATGARPKDSVRAGTLARSRDKRGGNFWATYLFLTVMAVIWLIPLLWGIYPSLRPKADTDKYGYFSIAGNFNLGNYVQAWNQGGFINYFGNSVLITVPTV